MERLAARFTVAMHTAQQRKERGDVPGWVLVTLMTALLVVALLAVARDRLVALFNEAMTSVE